MWYYFVINTLLLLIVSILKEKLILIIVNTRQCVRCLQAPSRFVQCLIFLSHYFAGYINVGLLSRRLPDDHSINKCWMIRLNHTTLNCGCRWSLLPFVTPSLPWSAIHY